MKYKDITNDEEKNSGLALVVILLFISYFMKNMLMKDLEKVNNGPLNKKPRLLFPEHHLSPAASAFYPSPFETAGILTIDGVGGGQSDIFYPNVA